MFYSEALLSKTGPLARIWLSANFGERKVPKKDVLHQNIGEGVSAIMDQAQAPLALRLNGHLLLGVVKIYSRKTRYLLDDCNEAILKIKMAFRPGNVDLPTNQSHTANPASLTLPDVLTELDLLAPLPDPSLLDNHADFSLSQRLMNSVDRSRAGSLEASRLDDSGFGDEFLTPRSRREREIEFGRDAPPSRNLRDDFDDTLRPGEGEDLELDIDFEEAVPEPGPDTSVLPGMLDQDNDLVLGGLDDDLDLRINDDDDQTAAIPDRHTSLPIAERDENTNENSTTLYEPEPEAELEEESVHQAQRAKRRKVLQADADTEMHSAQIKQQQIDRSKILKPASFLPKDPMLLALMDMQRTGGFVSSILGDGRSRGWAPELRGILSLEVVRKSSMKRKRADAGRPVQQSPQSRELQIQYQDEDLPPLPGSDGFAAADITLGDDNGLVLPSGGLNPLDGDAADGELDQTFGFDQTEVPLLHPDESGPVSLGTKHAVHLLREKFGAEAETSPSKRQKSSILFQDLLPQRSTTKADATKMFFEVLVLATKDAVKVEQQADELGGPLRIRARRGLWGSWAETSAGGEIAAEDIGMEA